jgi:hypothetical protein
MVEVAEAYPSVGVVSAYERCGHQVRLTGLPDGKRLVDGREACRQFLLEELFLFGAQTSVLYRADLVRGRNPFYVETDRYADFESCFALLSTSDLGFVHQTLTFSRLRPRSIGAISADIGAHFGSVLGLLFTYGRECLTHEEFDKCRDRHVSQYYRFLGRRLWVDRDRDFWSYHRETFAKAGIRFNRARLAKAAVGQLCGSVLHAKSGVESIKRFFSLRTIRNQQMRSVILDAGAGPSSGTDRVEDGDQPIG